MPKQIVWLAFAACIVGCARDSRSKAYLASADTALSQRKYPEVIQQSQRALRADGNDARAAALLGRAHLELGDFAQAYDYLLKARAHDPAGSNIQADLAHYYVIDSRLDDAREQARAMERANAGDVEAQALLGITAQTQKQIADAIHALSGIATPAGETTRLRIVLGILNLRRADTANAGKQFQEAIGQDAKSPEAHAALAGYELAIGNRPRAEAERHTAEALTGASPARRLEIARFFANLGQRSEAKRWLASVLAGDSTWLRARRLLAELQLSDGDSSAHQTIATILDRDSSDAEALLQRARVRLAAHDPRSAVVDLHSVLRAQPKLAPAHYQLAMAELALRDSVNARPGRPDSAVTQAVAELDSAARLTPSYPDATLALADIRLRTGHARDAIEDLDRFVQDNPQSIRGYELLAAVLSASGRADEANEAFNRVIAIDPDRAQSHFELGVALQTSGKKAEAIKEFENALALAPRYPEPMTQLVLMDLADSRPGPALDRVNEQLKRAPESAPLYDLLGLVHAARGETSMAESAYRRAVQLEPSLVDARVRLAELYDATGRYDLAIAHADSARRIEPRNLRALLALGVGCQQQGDTARARGAYEAALAINPHFAGAANNLALLLADEPGEVDSAFKFAAVAKQIAPNDPHVADTYGWILFKRGDYSRAMTILKQTAAKLPDSPAVLYHLGMVAHKMGDGDTARAALSKAVSSPTEFPGKDEARRTLAQLK